MWLAVGALFAADATAGVPTSTIVAGLFAVAAAVAAAWFGLRGTLRTTENQREIAFDQRVDTRLAKVEEENERLKARVEQLVAERNDYRERYAELRIAAISERLDPDRIVNKGAVGDQTTT